MFAFVIALSWNSANAQATPKATATTTASSPVVVDSAAAAAVWAKADTGRMMPGYQDLSPYDRPGYCLSAMQGKEQITWRRGESDTLPENTVNDTIPTVVREVGRACVAKMTPRTVPPEELNNLALLALRIGDTALARQTVDYHLSMMPNNAREQGYVLSDAIAGAVASRPMQIPFMESMLPRFTELDKAAVEAAVAAYGSASSVAHNRFDTAAMLRLGAARDALIQRLTPEERQAQGLDQWEGGAFADSLDIVWYQLIPTLSQTVNRLVGQILTANGLAVSNPQLTQALTALRTAEGTIPGQPAPIPKMFKRYPADAPLTSIPGTVTIVMPLRGIGNGRLDETLGRLRRLHERYHSRGLEVVLVGRTTGYAWGSPPLAAEAEANLFGWYYREHLKLPFTVLVEETSFSTKPDGRKVAAPSPFMTTYSPLPLRGYIIGRDGLMKSINYGFHSESELEAYIVRELAVSRPTAQSR